MLLMLLSEEEVISGVQRRKGAHLKAKERGLRRNQTCQCLNFDLLDSEL
jgi:hypothetical protein